METRIARPWVSDLVITLNTLDEQIQVAENRFGQQKWDKGITANIINYVGTSAMKGKEYIYPEGEALDAVYLASGGDVSAQLVSALSEMADVFPELKDPATEDFANGPTYSMRLAQLRGHFEPTGKGSSVTAILAYYESEEDDIPRGYSVLVFEDNASKLEREANIASMNQRKAQLNEELTREDITEDQVAQILANINAIDFQITSLQTTNIGSMESLLSLDSVGPAVIALIRGIFTTLKASDESWSLVEIENLMIFVVAAFSELSS